MKFTILPVFLKIRTFSGADFGWLRQLALLALIVSRAGLLASQEAPKPPAAKPSGEAAPSLPPPEEVERVTSDNVVVKATFFPGTQQENTVPVILLHSWRGSSKEYVTLAPYLQGLGHAVLVPDLRGHGQSKRVLLGTGTVEIDAARMGAEQFDLMVSRDMESWRSFLTQKNNEKALNLEKLCIVGSEMGASVALQYALHDWSWPPYAGRKQGQYVKALVLLSPQWNFKGLDARLPLAHPGVREAISVMILVGKQNPTAWREAQRLHAALAKYHAQPPSGISQEERARWEQDNLDLFIRSFDTKLQGSKMLAVLDLRVHQRIATFIQLRLVRKEFPWHEIAKKG